MTLPVTYTEIHSPDLSQSHAFLTAVFGWSFEPFATQDYLVAARRQHRGVDTGLMPSSDGQPRSLLIIRVPHLDDLLARVEAAGGSRAVPPFTVSGVGRGCYISDPAGVLLGLHEYNPDVQ